MSLNGLWELILGREAFSAALHGFAKSQTELSDWTKLNWFVLDLQLSLAESLEAMDMS